MQIEISANDVSTSDAITSHIHAKVEHAVRRFAERVTRVEVHLNDVNADKGGVDKRCMIEARLSGQQPMTAEHRSSDMYAAITAAAEKLERVLHNRLDRLADPRRA